MKEALFILLIILGLFALTAFRYRSRIRALLEFWRVVRSLQTRHPQNITARPEKQDTTGNLVNCGKCGTWIPESQAITLGGTSVFCSVKCLESSAKSAS